MYYDEVFQSIQGESKDSGIPCTFVRLFGCNVHCTYCDQPQKVKKKISVRNLVEKVRKFANEHVCITGGEPLIQEDVYPLIYELMSYGYKVSIETNGCVPIEDCTYQRSFRYVMDVKCPSSGVSHRNIYDNLIHLQSNDEVKFVIADRKDYVFMKSVLRSYPTSASILVSPMFDQNLKAVIGKELVDWILEDKLKVRIQLQIHKLLDVK